VPELKLGPPETHGAKARGFTVALDSQVEYFARMDQRER